MNGIPRFDGRTLAGDDRDLSAVIEAMTTVGCAVIERLVDDATVDRLLDEMMPWVEATPPGADDFSGRNTRRTGALLARSRTSIDFVANPAVLGVVDGVLGPNATNYQLHLTQMICIGPGSAAQPLHRDQWCFDFFAFPADFDVEVSTIWALDDFTETNGATRIVPNSLLDPREAVSIPGRDVPAEMPRGSVVLYTGRTIHGGGANASDRVRRALNVDYTLGWLRQEENQYLSCPPEVARHLPPHVQRLAGYAMGAHALGYVDDVRDPSVLLGATGTSSSFGGGTIDAPTAIPVADGA